MTITVDVDIDVKCTCGASLYFTQLTNGDIEVETCNECMEASKTDGYNEGFEEGENK